MSLSPFKFIAIQLLGEHSQAQVRKISDLATLCQVPLSTSSRFITKIGYPSFKHFIFDYSPQMHQTMSQKIRDNDDEVSFVQQANEQVHSSIKNLKGSVFILSSRRAKSLAKLMNERLNDGKIPNQLFRETKDKIENFVQRAC